MPARVNSASTARARLSRGTPGSTATAYAVAKAAVIYLTKCAALEFAEHRVRVNCVCPGVIATPIFGRGMNLPTQLDAKVAERAAAAMDAMQPIARGGRPDDIAEGVMYLADDRAGWVTGHALTIDGGIALGMTPGQREALWRDLRANVAEVAQEAG